MLMNINGNTLNGQLTSEVVTLIHTERFTKCYFQFQTNYHLNRHGFNPSSRATYTNLYPSTANFYKAMLIGRALVNSVKRKWQYQFTPIAISFYRTDPINQLNHSQFDIQSKCFSYVLWFRRY